MTPKTRALWVLAGLGAALCLTGVAGVLLMPRLMLREQRSPYNLLQTVQRITTNAVTQGWTVSSVVPLDESIRKHGGGQVRPVRLVNLCQAHHAATILNEDKARIVSVMMPCTIAVYEKADGKVYVGTMNAGLLGRMFGGVVAAIMGGPVAREQRQFVGFCSP
ncbi:MAG: DUF302 domain-containing protein [Verrucomicrobia bacterium]|nr:DUF302 domain-containing protein [Verrucomicrobiota bacterium]